MREYVVKVFESGYKEWYRNGKIHREDGPAIEYPNDGIKFWYHNGERHREDGPAAEWADGTKKWYQNGKLHREDGPAVEYPSGSKEWFLNGEEVTESDVIKKTIVIDGKSISISLKSFNELKKQLRK